MLTGQNPPDKPERRENEMAVSKTPIRSTIRLSLITGLDGQGASEAVRKGSPASCSATSSRKPSGLTGE